MHLTLILLLLNVLCYFNNLKLRYKLIILTFFTVKIYYTNE